MVRNLIWLLLLCMLIGCTSKELHRSDYEQSWPFRADTVKLVCQDDDVKAVWVEHNGWRYGMNGSGKAYLDKNFKEVTGRSHQDILQYDWSTNRSADVSWVIEEGFNLCGWS